MCTVEDSDSTLQNLLKVRPLVKQRPINYSPTHVSSQCMSCTSIVEFTDDLVKHSSAAVLFISV